MSTVYIRPQRYTYEFVERQGWYSLCFFSEQYKKALGFCGSKSGRDFDKAKETGLTPNFSDKAPYYEEASLVLICRKLYRQDMDKASFVDEAAVKAFYPGGDFHRMYVGAIETALSA